MTKPLSRNSSCDLKTWGIKYLCPVTNTLSVLTLMFFSIIFLSFNVYVFSIIFLSFLLGFGFDWEDKFISKTSKFANNTPLRLVFSTFLGVWKVVKHGLYSAWFIKWLGKAQREISTLDNVSSYHKWTARTLFQSSPSQTLTTGRDMLWSSPRGILAVSRDISHTIAPASRA